jgi:hypothetical protein
MRKLQVHVLWLVSESPSTEVWLPLQGRNTAFMGFWIFPSLSDAPAQPEVCSAL